MNAQTTNSSRYISFRKFSNYWNLFSDQLNATVDTSARPVVRRASLHGRSGGGAFAAGHSRKPEAGEKDRQDKGGGHSKKPSSFHNAGVSIVHCLSLLLADFTAAERRPCAIVPPVGLRSQGTSDRSPNVKGKRAGCGNQVLAKTLVASRRVKSLHRRSPGARCCPPPAAPVFASAAAARCDDKDRAAITAKDKCFVQPPFAPE